MKIVSIAVYQTYLPLVDGSYAWADGKSVTEYDSTVVIVTTDTGVRGVGEAVPLGPNYLPSYAAGVRAGIRELGPRLIGEDPTQLTVLNHTMDYHLKGHPYVKTALDMACWDILGKVTGLPVNTLLGGNFNPDGIPLYRAISQGTPEAMAATVRKYKDQGYSRFQLKLGGDPDTDILRIKECRGQLEDRDTLIGDSNTGWTSHQALRIAGVNILPKRNLIFVWFKQGLQLSKFSTIWGNTVQISIQVLNLSNWFKTLKIFPKAGMLKNTILLILEEYSTLQDSAGRQGH